LAVGEREAIDAREACMPSLVDFEVEMDILTHKRRRRRHHAANPLARDTPHIAGPCVAMQHVSFVI
jgi:hypothetical protein